MAVRASAVAVPPIQQFAGLGPQAPFRLRLEQPVDAMARWRCGGALEILRAAPRERKRAERIAAKDAILRSGTVDAL